MGKRIKKATTELEGALAERKLRMVALKEEMAEAKKQLKATREGVRVDALAQHIREVFQYRSEFQNRTKRTMWATIQISDRRARAWNSTASHGDGNCALTAWKITRNL